MKKILLMAAVLLSSVGAFAQHEVGAFTLQPKVGMNIANMTDFSNPDSKTLIGFTGGVEAEYQAADIFSISAGVLYSKQGCTFDDFTVQGVGLKDPTVSLDYINVPIMANVYVAKGLAVKLGVQPGFLVGSKLKGDINAGPLGSKDYDADIKDDMNKVDFTIPVGLSYEFSGVPVVIDARYNWGLTKTFKDDGYFNKDSKNSVFQITLGYKFEL